MGKTRRGHKEYSLEQRLKYENGKLRREISSLRKQLARLDLDRHSYIKDIVQEHLAEEESTGMLEKLKQAWKCRECSRGFLEIIIYNRPDAAWYYRHCTNCSHRTKSQKYIPDKVPAGPVKSIEGD